MSPEQAIYLKLSSDATVMSLVSDRVYQLNLPQRASLPAIRVQLIDQPLEFHLRGPDGLRRSRIQVDDFVQESQGYAVAEDIADAIDDALSAEPFLIGSPSISIALVQRLNRRSSYEGGELRHIRIMQDYFVWSRSVN